MLPHGGDSTDMTDTDTEVAWNYEVREHIALKITCVFFFFKPMKTWYYPRIIVSKSHENTSKCVDTMTLFFQKLEPKVIDP